VSPIRAASAFSRRATVTGMVSALFGLTACIMGLTLVLRGDPKALGDWGLLIGLFTTGANGLLAEHRSAAGRATDPHPPEPVA
jgi:hypothetical protein